MMPVLDAVALAKALIVLIGAQDHEGKCRHRARAEVAAPAILSAADAYDLDPLLLSSVAVRESDLNARAIGAANERGLTQIKPDGDVLRVCGKGLSIGDLHDPEKNARVGACWLAVGRERCGDDREKFLSWYNGRGCVASRYSRRILNTYRRLSAMTIHVLRERNFKLYVVSATLLVSRPAMRREWFDTGLRADPVNGEHLAGRKLRSMRAGEWEVEGSRGRLRVAALNYSEPDLTDEVQLPRPATGQRGEVVWEDGCWRVAIPMRRSRFLEAPDLLDLARM